MIYDQSNFPELPESWAVMTVHDAFTQAVITTKIKVKDYLATGVVPVIDQGSALIGGYTDDHSKIVATNLPTIVFGDHTRALKFMDFAFAAGADGIKVLTPVSYYCPRLLFRFLQSIKLPDRGYSRHFKFLRDSVIPLPPEAEQKRIADKLDALLARVDACRERLDRIPTLLKRFRQSYLNMAVSGELTKDWRQRIKGENWKAHRLSDLCISITDGDHQAPPRTETGIPFITISAINDGILQLGKATRFVPSSYFQALKESRRPSVGDILFSVTGSIAMAALVDTELPFVFQRHIAILKPSPALVSGEYLLYILGSENIRAQAFSAATGTAQLTIPLNGLRNFLVSVPSLDEQAEIVRRVEALFALADRIEQRYKIARAQVDKLTPSLLAKAFRGELVPQDPNDEPASALLARIRAQKTAAPKRSRKAP